MGNRLKKLQDEEDKAVKKINQTIERTRRMNRQISLDYQAYQLEKVAVKSFVNALVWED